MGKVLEFAGFRPDTLALFFVICFHSIWSGGAKCHVIHQKKPLVASILDVQLQWLFLIAPGKHVDRTKKPQKRARKEPT